MAGLISQLLSAIISAFSKNISENYDK